MAQRLPHLHKLLYYDRMKHYPVQRVGHTVMPNPQTWEASLHDTEGTPLFCRLDILDEHVFRLRVSLRPIEEKASLLLVKQQGDPCHPEFVDREERLFIRTQQLEIAIDKQQWQFNVKDRSGKTLLQEQHRDTATFLPVGPENQQATGHARLSPSLGVVKDGDDVHLTGSFVLRPDESFYGFGEKFSSLDKRGQSLQSYNQLSLVSSEGLNKCAPFFLSSYGYGLFFHSLAPQLFDMGEKSNVSWTFATGDDSLDLFFIYGPGFPQIIEEYTAWTGRPALPPRWSFGIWMSRCTYWTQTEVEGIAERMRSLELPCDVLRLDPGWFYHPKKGNLLAYDGEWNRESFPDPEGMMRRLREQGFRTCIWIHHMYIRGSNKWRIAHEKGYLARSLQDPADSIQDIDLTNPEAYEWYKSQIKQLLEQGAATFFMDMGMNVPDATYARLPGHEIRNGFSVLYSKAIYEAIEEFSGNPGVVWGLSGFAGTQRYPATGGGDSRCTFEDMASTLRGGLSAALSGFSIWGCDIGGFGVYPGPGPDKELYIRYIQHGFFLPIANVHGSGEREPWAYDDETIDIYKKYAQLRYRLLPYIYTQAYIASQTGLPMLRPLVLDYQTDLNVRSMDRQYLFGEHFLVAPVMNSAREQDVYLPEGSWYDYWTGEKQSGARWIRRRTPLHEIPLYVKAGAIIPMGPAIQHADETRHDHLELDIYPGDGTHTSMLYHREQSFALTLRGEENRFVVAVPPFPVSFRIHSQCLPAAVTTSDGSEVNWIERHRTLLIPSITAYNSEIVIHYVS